MSSQRNICLLIPLYICKTKRETTLPADLLWINKRVHYCNLLITYVKQQETKQNQKLLIDKKGLPIWFAIREQKQEEKAFEYRIRNDYQWFIND